MSLDKSWKTFMEEENYVDTYQQGYLHGASDFQQKALEKLQFELEDALKNPSLIPALDKGYDGALMFAIKIIKNLKA